VGSAIGKNVPSAVNVPYPKTFGGYTTLENGLLFLGFGNHQYELEELIAREKIQSMKARNKWNVKAFLHIIYNLYFAIHQSLSFLRLLLNHQHHPSLDDASYMLRID
jgi:hypothetical protein